MRDKLENASIYQKEENNGDMDEIEGSHDKQNLNIDDDGQIIISSDDEKLS